MKKTEIRICRTGKTIGQKGVAVIAIVAVLMAAVFIIEGVYVANFVADVEVVKRTARELAVINAVDTVEFAKKALHHAVSYSFYKASYDVLERGCFCAFDEDLCKEDCKIPYNIPTQKCRPWWRVYDGKYAPDLLNFKAYLSNRTSAIYDDYASLFFGPQYCPQPPGKVTIEDKGKYTVRVDVANTEGGVIEYRGENLNIVEHTVSFTDVIEITTFEMFLLGRKKFVDEDGVKNAFETANNKTPNSCEDMEVSCGIPKEPECVELDPYAEPDAKCKYKNQDTCKYMWFDGVCENEMPDCEDYLGRYCCKEDNWEGCDFNEDEKVDANERYNCTALDELENLEGTYTEIDPSSYLRVTVDTAREIGNCIKVDHKSDRDDDGARVSCDWEEVTSLGDPCCVRVRDEKCCGCGPPYGDECIQGEDCGPHPNCVSASTAGEVCPPYSDYACDSDDCGYWTCSNDCVDMECEGSATPCSSYGLEGYCISQKGCDWEESTEEGVAGNCTGDATECDELSGSACGSQDGCNWNCVNWGCAWGWGCNANVCGYSCCEETVAVVEDVSCTFEYYGTANLTVNVFDEENRYPISGWEKLNLPFYVVSGNAKGCSGEAETDICCPAITTHELDKVAQCKTKS